MEKKTEVKVIVKERNGKTAPGKVFIQTWTKQERTERALKTLGLFWGLAILSVFLPVAHFFLVPGFLIAGPIVARRQFSQESIVLGGESTCPGCSKPLSIEKGTEKWPLDDMCSQCQVHVTIEKA